MKIQQEQIIINNIPIKVYTYNTVVVGSGAASFNAAAALHKLGQTDIALVTEGLNRGTSRNTGSDKQTYYKQSTTLQDVDSPMKMAQTLFSGGAMHGDIALTEAALSLKSFYNLIEIGVPFPHDTFGQYIGYKTDHDENSRASSVGPLTSKYMTEKLEAQVLRNGTPIFDHFMVISILKDDEDKKTIGLLALDLRNLDAKDYGLTVFNCTNIVFGTGGPAHIYYRSVYPKSQTGATGIALEAGAKAHNLTEWQYGIASTKFRWNLSGTYQQVIPRYISSDENGNDERDFLEDYYQNPTDQLNAVFLKGYQWPFDSKKLINNGSSVVDLLIYIETQIKGRRVFMDFIHNPKCAEDKGRFKFDLLGKEAFDYLDNSNALLDTPIQRLKKMNPLAIDLYLDHHINIEKEYLEIDVCAQHQNGGLLGNHWWESNLSNFFPVGEANGTLGIYRPGGTALNSTQVGSYRAAEYIVNQYPQPPLEVSVLKATVTHQVEKQMAVIQKLKVDITQPSNVLEFQLKLQKTMSRAGAFIRSEENLMEAWDECKDAYENLHQYVHIKDIFELPKVFRIYDMLITQMACVSAMLDYAKQQGDSRGSYLISDNNGSYEVKTKDRNFQFSTKQDYKDRVCETKVCIGQKKFEIKNQWVQVRPIPQYDAWFENVWADFRENNIYKK